MGSKNITRVTLCVTIVDRLWVTSKKPSLQLHTRIHSSRVLQAAGQHMAATWEAAAAAGWDPAAASSATVVDVVGGHVGHMLEPQHAEQQLDMSAPGSYEEGYALQQQHLQQQQLQVCVLNSGPAPNPKALGTAVVFYVFLLASFLS